MKLKFTISICACLILLSVNNAHARLRLTAVTNCYSDSSSNFVPNDSSWYIYSGYRSGGLTFSTYGWTAATSCDTTYADYYIKASGTYFTSTRMINTYDSHDNLLTQLYQLNDTTHGIWYNLILTTNTYDANNNQLTSLSQYWDTTHGSGGVWLNSNKDVKTYDANNNNITDTSLSFYGGIWNYSQVKINSYDSHNYLLNTVQAYYVTGTWTNSYKTNYALNADHKPDSIVEYVWYTGSSSWVPSRKNAYTYDASYNMLTDTLLTWSTITPGWQASSLNLYTYSGTDVTSQEQRTNFSGSGWDNTVKYKMAYDANHNMLTYITQYWKAYKSAYDDYSKATNVYNTNNKVISYTTTTWDSASAAWIQRPFADEQSRFYYEPYTGLAVNNISADQSVMKLYPSPASSYINVDLSHMDNKAVILAIYDAAGRLYKQWQSQAGNSYHATVPVNELSAGNYFLEMREGQSQKTTQFSVVH